MALRPALLKEVESNCALFAAETNLDTIEEVLCLAAFAFIDRKCTLGGRKVRRAHFGSLVMVPLEKAWECSRSTNNEWGVPFLVGLLLFYITYILLYLLYLKLNRSLLQLF